MKTVIINYGMGNLRSVANAFEILECPAVISDNPEDLHTADKIVLPGVGAYGDGMANLRAAGWVDALNEEVRQSGKPFIGLCLGMQLLSTIGTEHGQHEGLGWIPGVTDRIVPDDPSLRVPHIGWNDVTFLKDDGMYAGLGDENTFYFVHSYVLYPEDASLISGTVSYGEDYAASVQFDNIWATQYHPEKSQKAGLAVLRNFIDW